MTIEPKLKETKLSHKLENDIWKLWEKENAYKFNVNSKKKIFVIDTPPPYPSGRPWHVGAAAHFSQIDMIARTARMMGFETFFPIGIDRNGVPVERYTEKKFEIKMHETPRGKFIELCKIALDDLEAEMIQIMKTMGLSCDFDNYYRTDSEEYRKLTQSTFIDLWKRGLIYEEERLNNFCHEDRTTIADADISYVELSTKLNYVYFTVKETGKKVVIATTRPELLCTAAIVIFNPSDSRYKELEGKTAAVPIYNIEIPIQSHPSADPEFGSGLVYMSRSAGDLNAVRFLREMKIEPKTIIDMEGKMTKDAGFLEGLKVGAARKKISEELNKEGFLEKQEQIVHRTPVCDRCKNVIDYILTKEFYLKQIGYVSDILSISKKLKFHPEAHRSLLIDWVNSVSIDWPITRRRFYGTEVPVWNCKKCNHIMMPEKGKYYQPWKDKPPFAKCEKCGGELKGDERTFDTWVDSSISPLFISRYMKDDKFFKKTYPNTLRPQGKDIIRTWLYYTLLRCFQLTNKSPFDHAWIMGYGVDEKGEKMSKSKGNVIDPIPLLEKNGADVFRFWAAYEASLGSDFRCSEQRIESAGKFLTKLWNISRFISMFPIVKEVELVNTDKWILSELSKLVEDSLKGYNDFNFFIPANKIRDFTWGVFADHYVEMVKTRAYGEGFTESEQKSAQFTLHLVLKTILKLLAPITPFVTDHIWRELYGKKALHLEQFPTAEWDVKFSEFTKKIMDFNSQVWNEKKSKQMSLKDEIEMKIPLELKPFEKDLKAMHKIKN